MVTENKSNAEVETRNAEYLPHSLGDQLEILIVEDSPVSTELLRRSLTRAGYTVMVAKDGEEGLQAARAHRPTLVMSDINMPVMNGYQLCRAIKLDDDLWNIPVILLTILSGPEDIIEAINSGADAYIVKPFIEAYLLERIRSLLEAPIERRLAEERRVELVSYSGKRHTIVGGGQQILNLLFSVYENTLNQNRELIITQSQLNQLNEDLDEQVRERTAALDRINRALRTLSAGNHALVRAKSEEELLRDAVLNIVENGGYCLATIIYIGGNQVKSLTRMASAGAGEDIFPTEELLTMADANKVQTLIVRAIDGGQMQVCHDIATDQRFAPWKDSALAHGYAANIALPLANGSAIFGCLNIFSSEANTFDKEEATLLEELAEDIAYGIVNLRAQAALHTAELALRESEERHRLLFENSHDALMTLAPPSWKFTSANKATLQLFGAASTAEFTALGPWDISPERQPDGRATAEKAQEMIAIALRKGSNFFEWEHQRLDGTPFSVDVLLTAVEQGGQTSLQATVRDITERKRAEKLLHESELRYRRLFEAAKDGILIIDAETGKIIDANPFILELLSYSLSECCGKTLWEIGLSGNIESSKISFQELQTKEYQRYEDLPLETKDGRQIDVEFISNLYKVGNRKVIQCNIRDISEHKQAEKALRDSEARYKRITEGLTDYQYTVHIENGRAVKTWQSPACLTVTGYTAEEFSANPHLWLQMVVPEHRDSVKQHVSQILTGKDVTPMEHCIIRKDGASRWVSDTTILFKDAAGKLLSYDGVIKDITERKKSEEFIENILECVDEGFVIIDRNFQILSANKAYSHLVAMPIDTIIGRHCHEVSHHSSVPCSESERDCPLQKVFATGKSHSAIHKYVNTQGEEVCIEIKAYPHSKDNTGKITTAIETLLDITEKYKLENQLRQSQKMEAIGTLAGGIAHDFNNMLGPILGYSEMALARLSPDDPLAEDLQQVLSAAERAKGLVQQILAFSRQAPQERKLFQPQTVVKEALKLIRASLPSTIEIREEIPAECGTILADPTQIHQIIMNLCTNAYHAMRETGGVLEVNLAQVTINDVSGIPGSELTPGKYILIEINDTGCGMDQKTLTHIFDPYFTTKTKGDGTGLGLSVVHGIVKSYQGHITVDSEPGQGTHFHVYLPRIAAAPSLPETVRNETIPTGTERLLVVDDDEFIAIMLQRMLQPLGYQVHVSCNSLEALALIEKAPMTVDLLITDMTMPHLTGSELAQKVLAIRADLPIILCTGFSDLINKKQALALGIRAYLMKPVSIHDLSQTVRTVLDTKKKLS